ncbi:hypothetical protein [Methylobacterium sp. Leaf87]|uniref:hypothetical protein n=1 Tax=Methylobacterium sp. Leaf87 TaxID=1736243 RepID=UPI0012E7EDD7|nr:hypothetical protein [Methylobacterium sp. Leaf87]
MALLDRGWGRPKQSVDVKVDHNASGLAHAIAADQERMQLAAAPQQAVNIIKGEVIGETVDKPLEYPPAQTLLFAATARRIMLWVTASPHCIHSYRADIFRLMEE